MLVFFAAVPGSVTVGGTNTSGTATFSGTLALHDNVLITSAAGGTVAFTGQIQNGDLGGANNQTTGQALVGGTGGGVTLNGLGTVLFSNSNSYVGTTAVNSGALTITNSSALGTTASGTSVASGAVLRLDGSASPLIIGAEALTLNGAGLTGAPAGALRNFAGTNSWAGAIPLGSASTITSSAGTITLTGGINNASFLTTFDGAGNTTVSTTKITGSGGVTKTGAGTLTLSAANDYTGATAINGGTLKLSGSIAAGSAVSVNSGGTLAGGGTVNGTLAINSGGKLSPGNSPGTINSGATSYNGGGTYVWEINNATGTQGTDPGWDWNNITGTLTIGATSGNEFIIDITGLSGASPGSVANFNKYGTYDWNIATASSGISGFDASDFTLALGNFTNNNSITGSLSNGAFSILTSGNNLVVRYTGATECAPATAYWTGDTAAPGTRTMPATPTGPRPPLAPTDTAAVPGSTSNVYFTATGATNFTNTLGQDFSINSLNYTSGSSSGTRSTANADHSPQGINNASANAQTINSADRAGR